MGIEEIIKKKIVESEEVSAEVVDAAIALPTEEVPAFMTIASNVMTSYQNANKWLDSIKETLLIDKGCVFFSNYVHNLAHTMPARFDKFGDILHTANAKVMYPGTTAISKEPSDLTDAFSQIFEILTSISVALRGFIKTTQDTEHHAMACAAEELLVDIEGEYTNLYRMKKAYEISGDVLRFDKWVAQYVKSSGSLLD